MTPRREVAVAVALGLAATSARAQGADPPPLVAEPDVIADPQGRPRGRVPVRQPHQQGWAEEFLAPLAGCKDPELRAVILVLCMTTLRLRELLNRRWSEIHLKGPPRRWT